MINYIVAIFFGISVSILSGLGLQVFGTLFLSIISSDLWSTSIVVLFIFPPLILGGYVMSINIKTRISTATMLFLGTSVGVLAMVIWTLIGGSGTYGDLIPFIITSLSGGAFSAFGSFLGIMIMRSQA